MSSSPRTEPILGCPTVSLGTRIWERGFFQVRCHLPRVRRPPPPARKLGPWELLEIPQRRHRPQYLSPHSAKRATADRVLILPDIVPYHELQDNCPTSAIFRIAASAIRDATILYWFALDHLRFARGALLQQDLHLPLPRRPSPR